MNSKRRILAAMVAVAAIAGSWFWIYHTQFAAPKINEALHVGVGEALARETAKTLAAKGRVVVITLPAGESEILASQVRAFRARTKTVGLTILDTVVVDPQGKTKFGPGRGLSSKILLKTLEKHPNADAIVSFIGAPELDEAALRQLKLHPPKLIAEHRAVKKLLDSFRGGLLQTAIVPRFQFPAPGRKDPHTPQEWFDSRFQIVTAEMVATADAADRSNEK